MNEANGLPSFFMIFGPVLACQAKGIIKHMRRQFERNPRVFSLVREVLVLIPSEPKFHHYNNVTTIKSFFKLPLLGVIVQFVRSTEQMCKQCKTMIKKLAETGHDRSRG